MKKNSTKLLLIALIFLLTSITVGLSPIGASTSDTVTISPENPNVGDIITIQYDTSTGTLDSSSASIYLQWAFIFNGNFDENQQALTPVPPSKLWYVENTAEGYAGRFLSSPMTNISATVWEISIEAKDDLPDRIQFFFSDTADGLANRDRNDNNYWFIDPQFAADYVYIIDPSFAETNFYLPGGSITITARGNAASTDWEVQLTDRTDEPIDLVVTTSSHDAGTELWTIIANIPAVIDEGLYDLKVSTSVGGFLTTDIEENSIQITAEYKNDYTIVLLGDQEMNAYAGVNYAVDGGLHQGHNLSTFLTEMSVVNADLFVNLGSATFWGDVETMQQYREYVGLFYNLPHVYVSSHRDRFMGSEADWEYRGAGIGALDKIVGIRHKEWTYGDHYYVSIFTGDHRMDDSEIAWFDAAMSASTGDAKFGMIHDPIGYETDYNPGEINAIDVDGRTQLAPICKSNGLDYWIHTSAGIDGSQAVTETGAFHIGMAGAISGYRILQISGDVIAGWGYNDSTDGLYPFYKVNANHTGLNDGTETTAVAVITNNLLEDLPAARTVFKMAPGVYETDKGSIFSQYTKDGMTYVEVNVLVTSGANETLTVTKVADLPTSTTDVPTSVPTTTDTSIPTTTTTSDDSTPIELYMFALGLIVVTAVNRKKNRK